MNKFLTAAAVFCLYSNTIAAEQCDLEGAGKLQVYCENKGQLIKVKFGGGDAASVHSVSAMAGSDVINSNPESDLPATVFERIDEGVFTLKSSTSGGSVWLTGIPRTFLSKAEQVYRPRSIIYSGSFSALVDAYFNSSEKLIQDALVQCTFEIRSCPRSRLDLPSRSKR
jgi:hypothetical protein